MPQDPYKFGVIESDFDALLRVRAYDVILQFPGFRTREHVNKDETNVAKLRCIYSPHRRLLEFESFYRYILSFKDKEMTLEQASWSIIDDIFSHLSPLHCRVTVICEMNDRFIARIEASRGWKNFSADDCRPETDGYLTL